MTFRGDDRAVTVQIGAVLLFGSLIVAMSAYQVAVVPAANEETEFRHSQHVQSDLQRLYDAVGRTAAGGAAQSTSVAAGTNYAPRTLFVNPPDPSGSLRTTGDSSAGYALVNAEPVGANATREFWASRVENGYRAVRSEAMVYSPNYNEYGDAPDTVVEGPLVYNRFGDADVALTGQSLVNGRTVSLIAFDGSRSASTSGTVSVATEPLSASTTTVPVRGRNGNPIELYVLTTASESLWRDRLADEIEEGHVQSVENPWPNRDVESVLAEVGVETASGERVSLDEGQRVLRIRLDADRTYRLRMAKVGVGSGATDPGPAYLVRVDHGGSENGENGRVTVEVRDEYNNPVAGATVEAASPLVNEASLRTRGDGRATFTYDAGEAGTVRLRLEGATETYEEVEIDVAGAGGGRLTISEPARSVDPDGDGTAGGFAFVVRNHHGSRVNVTSVRVVPDDPRVNGLRDASADEGEGKSELHIAALDGGTDGTVDVQTRSNRYQQEFLHVSARGSVLSTTQSRTERLYDAVEKHYEWEETVQIGTPAVPAGGRARLSFAEFYDVRSGGYSDVGASGLDFTVVVSYEVGGVRMSDTFVVRPG